MGRPRLRRDENTTSIHARFAESVRQQIEREPGSTLGQQLRRIVERGLMAGDPRMAATQTVSAAYPPDDSVLYQHFFHPMFEGVLVLALKTVRDGISQNGATFTVHQTKHLFGAYLVSPELEVICGDEVRDAAISLFFRWNGHLVPPMHWRDAIARFEEREAEAGIAEDGV